MITELGHYALILALATALVQSLVPLIGAQRNDAGMMAVGPMAANLSFVLVAFSFLTLTYAYVISDFSVLNVVENSHSMKPMLYKITGVWGNHEGSMLLWVLILVLFSALVANFGRNLPDKLRANVLSAQAWITVAFLLFILLTSNPFMRLANPPAEGNDLNPILQDLGLAIHPPLLYLGYVGFSISFSFAIAALIEGRLDAAWARWVRPWTLVAWTFLTAGISMGSYWAYYELGWGGWWFWDPVENASFMPWLAGTALLHSALVMEKREALKVWTVLLSILTFSFSLLGTFLVRSGVLTSVHAFATDPARGVFILGILAVFIGGAFALFGLRATALRTGGLFAPISREGALVLNNLFLTTATATVLVGTLYPLLLEATTGTKISVGAPFFNLTFGPLMIPLMIAVPFGPLLAWKRGDLMGATQRLYAAIGISILVGLVVMAFTTDEPVLAAAGMAIGAFVILGALTDLVNRSGAGRLPAATAWARFKGLPRSAFGTAFAHAGLGITMIGVVAASVYSTEHVSAMNAGDTVEAGGYTVRFEGLRDVQGPNYTAKSGLFVISRGGAEVARVTSAKRFYPARQMPTTEAGIRTFGASQLYVALGDMESNGKLVVRVWWKSWVTFIWYGTVLMMIGGALSLSDRRLRIGAPRKAARPARTAEAVA
ncbi:heme lyase CcmF/NrfE family subunit [Pseudohoeflea suaedae]|uniref:Heme lyase CcmF/NrfE family subunit n=1 Tax=Pseudohoeflea suaedae TaxID=877384 RepID=A0A4R5PPR6_9HYPH|nr:heme lyase CcmF/NrfE family subunit [Pseudohoeflea suaedae]TDH38863.1 heme lyase CcmF/NrfE family subunit [Pseudohoeflea suaedae]